ncbi:LptF/LptG family permease [uncultured Roseivirga sp.]|uniref:LptF/LptG family permease n=1 Tax=uncultured Roseivirga sp. TaxID=543088 RepID=UPI0030D9919E|tara:strand:- start:96684 stop:98351 length:1668 start_codon:yes stop_codon:yes gene_type:complete
MKKIDKLVFGSFIGPFLLTLIVVDFILLLVTLLKYFDQIMGKGLEFSVFAELITYFSISASPDAFPLAVLLSAIMTFGNLGEHSELTAVKSSGISLVRSLAPIFVFVLFLTGFTYYFNTELVPKTNLKTYSLLWDMRSKKPALDIREGVFYNGIPGYSIKVNKKIDDERLLDIIIYDHTNRSKRGNKEVILADSGRMYTFMNQRYLALELYSGIKYDEGSNEKYDQKIDGGQFVRNRFSKSIIRFDLSSFDMGETDQNAFSRSRLVQTRGDLKVGVDSMSLDILRSKKTLFRQIGGKFSYHMLREVDIPEQVEKELSFYDSLRTTRKKPKAAELESLVNHGVEEITLESRDLPVDELPEVAFMQTPVAPSVTTETKVKGVVMTDDELVDEIEAFYNTRAKKMNIYATALNSARSSNATIKANISTLATVQRDKNKFKVTRAQQISRSFACLVMFLIGAPIGAIIKKGGLGLPVIISVIFFLIYYTLNTMGDKWGKQGVVDPLFAMWMANLILLPFGLFFLRQASKDARLFEADFYAVWLEKIKKYFTKKKQLKTA